MFIKFQLSEFSKKKINKFSWNYIYSCFYKWGVEYYPYHWQYLKIQPKLKGNENNEYSRQHPMNLYVETKDQNLSITSVLLLGIHFAPFFNKMSIQNTWKLFRMWLNV